MHFDATCNQSANEFPLLTKGHDQVGACDGTDETWEIALRAGVGNVERAMLAYPADLWLIDRPHVANGYVTKMSTRNHRVPLAKSQHHIINPTNPRGALDDGIQDGLDICRRAAHDAEHLGRSRLMLQCLAQFRVALLKLFEQTHVLDGDDRLVGKGFEKFDLRRRE